MAWEAVQAVFRMRGLEPHEKLVALRYAEKANADGSDAYPSVGTVAKDTGMSSRGVQKVVGRLVKLGVLALDGMSEFGTKCYRLDLTWEGVNPVRTPEPDTSLEEPHAGGEPGSGVNGVTHPPEPERGSGVNGVRPTLPVPVPNPSVVVASPRAKHPAKRKARLPDQFFVTADMRSWAERETPSVDVTAETKQFVDHWRGKGETRADWIATWRTWMRNAAKWRSNGKARASVGADTVDALQGFAQEDQ